VLDRINGAALVERTLALLRLGLDIAGATPAPSAAAAALDYDDLIVATRRLLESADSAAWVLYKLDGGIDHVLVDEAQDTNPDQWEVIRRLTEEFFVGRARSTRTRTIFAVGDTKQSIFGFQRADPRKLKEMREWFDERSRSGRQALRAGRPQRLLPLDAGRARCRRLGVQRARHRARPGRSQAT
jgi:ATP-dependent helicase/nuclease subunit A